MATKGKAHVSHVDQHGRWVIDPDMAGLDVLRQAMKDGAPIEVRLTIPKRGKQRRAFEHTLRLTD